MLPNAETTRFEVLIDRFELESAPGAYVRVHFMPFLKRAYLLLSARANTDALVLAVVRGATGTVSWPLAGRPDVPDMAVLQREDLERLWTSLRSILKEKGVTLPPLG